MMAIGRENPAQQLLLEPSSDFLAPKRSRAFGISTTRIEPISRIDRVQLGLLSGLNGKEYSE